MTVVALDRRPVLIHVEHRQRQWHGRVLLAGERVAEVHGPSRAALLADLLDALLANDVDIDPCCALDGEGEH